MLSADFEVLDKRFNKLVFNNVVVDKLWTGCRWAEGPAYFPAGKYLIWSDIPNDRLLRYDETDSSVSVYQAPCQNQNGHAVDHQGRLISCEHRQRAVSRIEHDGSRTLIAGQFEGKRLNSPNDVVVKSDGTIWFTDPTYGIDSEYEGDAAPSEIGSSWVYRADPASGSLAAVVTDMFKPNGLAFSPDESVLYVSDTGTTHDPDFSSVIRAYPISADGKTLQPGKVFATCSVGIFDGFRVDVHANIWTSAGDGVHCYAPDGALIGKIRIPEVVANVTFGGPKLNRLFICATSSLYVVYLNTRGIFPADTRR